MRLASILLGVPLVATILIATIRGARHFDEGWPTHAEHHLVAFMAVSVGISVIGLLILGSSMQRGEGWAWWALLVAGLTIFGGFWLGVATVGLGDDATAPYVAQGILSALYLVGLALAWRPPPAPASAP